MTIMVDSNIWAYYFDETMQEHKQTAAILEKFLEKKEVVITTVIAIETIHYLFRKLAKNKARDKAKVFIQGEFEILDIEESSLEKIIEKLYYTRNLGIGGRDASILVAMEKEKITKILTHDQAFKKLPEIEVIDPIKK